MTMLRIIRSLCVLVLSTGVFVNGIAAGMHFGEQLFELSPSDAAYEDYFGQSVAIGGAWGLIGAPGDDRPRSTGSVVEDEFGAAYVFDLSTGLQTRKIIASDAGDHDDFGGAVAISDNVAVIGARLDDDRGNGSGSAYLFDLTTGNQLFKLLADDAAPLDLFGDSVAIHSGTALIGSGQSAYLFDVATGAQRIKLTASDAGAHEFFGKSVALTQSYALVGEGTYDGIGTNSGAVYVFDRDTGQEVSKLVPMDSQAFDGFGWKVAAAGNLAVVGAWIKDDHGDQSGAAYIFDLTTGRQLHKLIQPNPAAGDHFGGIVSINSTIAAVGTLRDILATEPTTNSIYLFDLVSGQFIQELKGADTIADDGFGLSVALGDRVALVGATDAALGGIQSGTAYAFSIIPEPSLLGLFSLASCGMPFLRRR